MHCAVWPLPHLCALCLRVSLTCFLVQEALRELLAAKMTEAICDAEERMVQRVAVAGNRDSTKEEVPVCAAVSLWSKHRRAWRGSRGIVSISTSIISICYCLVFLLKLIVTLQAKGYLDGEAGTAYSSKVYFELPSSGEWCVHCSQHVQHRIHYYSFHSFPDRSALGLPEPFPSERKDTLSHNAISAAVLAELRCDICPHRTSVCHQ